MISKNIAALILSIGIAISGYFVADGLVVSRQMERTVVVRGLAERLVKSDEAIWTMNFRVVNNDLSALYQNLADTQNKIRAFLKSQGFDDNEIFTNPVSVTDNQSVSYSQNQNMPRYSADSGLSVATTKVDKVTETVQKTGVLVQQGVVMTSSNAVYRYNNLNAIKPELLDEATMSAEDAAQSFAKRAQAVLGQIRVARQGLFTISDAVSGYDSGTSVMKKVRVVTTVEYDIKKP